MIGLSVSQKNKNVLTSLDTEKVFSSAFSTMPISKIITLEYTTTSFTNVQKVIKHGLSFVPYYFIFYKSSEYPTKWIWYPPSYALLFDDFAGDSIILDKVDKENITFTVSGGLNNGIIKVVLVIFAFPIALSI